MFFLLSLLSAVAIGGAIAIGGGGGGGGGPVHYIHRSHALAVNPSDTVVSGGETNVYKTGEYKNQWGLGAIKAAEAYKILSSNGLAVGGDGVKIAIIDTGVELNHRELFLNTSSGHSTPSDDWNSHGTHVAGIAAASKDNAFMHGVAFNADILAVRVALVGDPAPPMSSNAGVRYATDQGAKVANMSFGAGPIIVNNTPGSQYSNSRNNFATALGTTSGVINGDMVMTVSTGNDSDNNAMSSPAIFAGDAVTGGKMIAVASLDDNNALSSFSNVCKQAKDFCLSAPGRNIYSSIPDSPFYGLKSGTSMAAPHVAGAAAVIRGAWAFLTAAETVDILLSTATDLGAAGTDDIYGRGMLNLEEAVKSQGISSLVASNNVSGFGYDVDTSSMSTSSIFGDAYSSNVAPILKNAVFFDMYGRDYKANLDQKISGSTNASYDLDNLMFSDYSSASLPFSFGHENADNLVVHFNAKNTFTDEISGDVRHNKFGLKNLTTDNSREDQSAFNSSDVAFSYSHNFDKNNKFSFSKNDFNESFNQQNPAYNYNLISFNNFTSSPYKKLSLGGSRNNFTNSGDSMINSNQFSFAQNISDDLTTSVSFASYNQSSSIAKFKSDESRIFESTLGYKFNSITKFNFGFGNLNEMNQNFLGSKTDGAFTGGSDPQTKYFNFNVTRNLFRNWQFTSSISEGKTEISGNNLGVFRDFSNIKSRGSAMGLLNENFFGGRLAIIYSEPLRIYKGKANIDIPISRDNDGNVQRLTANDVSLRPSGKEQDLEFSYGFGLKNIGGELNFNSIIQKEAGNIKQNKDQYVVMLRYNLKY